MNNDDLKEEIKNRIKLSEIISKKVILKKKSENSFIGLCPFHSEKTPSSMFMMKNNFITVLDVKNMEIFFLSLWNLIIWIFIVP